MTFRDVSFVPKITCAFHMFTVIVTCPRRVNLASIVCMRRQQTLGAPIFINTIAVYLTRPYLAKFITMPPGKKAPPQQASLTELWGSKRKKQDTPAAAAAPAPTPSTSGGLPKLQLDATDATVDADPTTSSERA